MTIFAVHLHGPPVGAFEVALQMDRMIELDGAGIAAAGAYRSKFRMATVESRDVVRETGRRSCRVQVCMAPRATAV